MSNSCTADEGGHLPLISQSVGIMLGLNAFNLALLFYIRVIQARPPARNPYKSPDYGIGASAVVAGLLYLPLVFELPQGILSIVLAGTGWGTDLGCNLQKGFYIFTYVVDYIVLQFLFWSFFRRKARHSVVADLRLDELPANATVLNLRAYRGFLCAPIANEIGPAGCRLIGVDAYGTRFCPEPVTWPEENMVREGEVAAQSCDFRSALTFADLPVKDGSVDLTVIVAPTYTPWVTDDRIPKKEQKERLMAMLLAVRRATKPGGRFVAVTPKGRLKAATEALERAGFQSIEQTPNKYWFALPPFRGVQCVSPGPPSEAEMELAGNYAQPATAIAASASSMRQSSTLLSTLLGEDEEEEEEEGGVAGGEAGLDSGGVVNAAYHAMEVGGDIGPPDRTSHPALRAGLMAIAFAVAGLLLWGTVAGWDSFEVPKAVSWSARVGNQVGWTVASLPGTLVYIATELRTFSKPWERNLSQHSVPARRIVRKWGQLMGLTVVVYSAINLIYWLPVFLVGWFLSVNTSFSDSAIQVIGILLSIAILFFVSWAGKRIGTARKERGDDALRRKRLRSKQ